MVTACSLVLLDRDGVINIDRDDYVKSEEEWIPIDGAVEAIRSILNRFDVAVCTNQSAVGRGLVSSDVVDAIHQNFRALVGVTASKFIPVYVCTHKPDDDCGCRKPKPGLLDLAIEEFDADRSKTYFVGDSMTDILAARNAGCIPVLVRTGRGLESEKLISLREKLLVFDDLLEFSKFLSKR